MWREVGVHVTSECKIAKKTKKREKPLSYLKFQVWPSALMLLEEIVAWGEKTCLTTGKTRGGQKCAAARNSIEKKYWDSKSCNTCGEKLVSKVNRAAFLLNIANHCWRQISDIWSAPHQQLYAPIEEEKLPKKWGGKNPEWISSKSKLSLRRESVKTVRQRKKLGKLELQRTRWVGLRTGNSGNMKILPIDVVSCKS